MKDETMLKLSILASITIVGLALVLRDRGTYIVRDAQGNITAILPARGPLRNVQRNSPGTPIENVVNATELSTPYLEANR